MSIKPSRDTILHMQINADLKAALAIKAAEENRSLSNFVETALLTYIGGPSAINRPKHAPADAPASSNSFAI